MINKFITWIKNLFSTPEHKIPNTQKEFEDIERRLKSGEDVTIPELAYLLRYLAEKDKKN